MQTGKQTKAPRGGRGLIWAAGLMVMAAGLIIFIFYIRIAVSPLESYDIGPGSDPARWTFRTETREEITPEEGRLPLEGENTTVICETAISNFTGDAPLIVVSSKSADCAFFLDGQMIYSPSGRFQDGAFSNAPFSSVSGQFGIPKTGEGEVRKLTVYVQFQGEENRLSRMPKITTYSSVIHYYSKYTGPAATDALSAGIYYTAALVLAGLYLAGIRRQQGDAGLILLAGCALSMAFYQTASFAYGVMLLFWTPTITWVCSTLPMAAMSWMIWYRLGWRMRRFSLILPGAGSVWIAALFFLGIDNMHSVNQMHIISAWVMPGILMVMLGIALYDAGRGNAWFRRFFRYFAWALPVVGIAWGISTIIEGGFGKGMRTVWENITGANPSFYFFGNYLCALLLILCFIQAVMGLIENMARQDAEMRAIALREKYTAENLEIMRQSQEETRRQRHELRHHFTLLNEMISQKQTDRAAEYIQTMLQHDATLPSANYSRNMVVNATAGHYLNTAKKEGIQVSTEITIAEKPPIRDEDLCILLTNMMENALEACRKMKAEEDKFISLTISSNEEHMMILCENSTAFSQISIGPDGTIPSSKADGKNHGYGLPAIRQIVEKYAGMMDIAGEDGRFTVKVKF